MTDLKATEHVGLETSIENLRFLSGGFLLDNR